MRFEILFIIAFSSFSFIVNSQTAYQKITYNAFKNSNMKVWVNVIYTIEQDKSTQFTQKMELLNYYYGYTGFLIGKKDSKEAEIYIGKAEKLLYELQKIHPDNADLCAYKGAFIGFRIGVSRFKAIYLGQESINSLEKSLSINSQNFQGLVDRANAYFHAPSLFGGDKQKSLILYVKAVHALEQNENTKYNWQYLNTLVSLAKNYSVLENSPKAIAVYQKVLDLEPDFKWVRDVLLPAEMKKLKSK